MDENDFEDFVKENDPPTKSESTSGTASSGQATEEDKSSANTTTATDPDPSTPSTSESPIKATPGSDSGPNNVPATQLDITTTSDPATKSEPLPSVPPTPTVDPLAGKQHPSFPQQVAIILQSNSPIHKGMMRSAYCS